jgi:hypothetical protein
MAWTSPRTWTNGETVTDAMLNQHVRDNMNALWVGTTTGDLDYYASATVKSRLAIGATGKVLTPVGGVPAWKYVPACQISAGASTQVCANATDTDVAAFSTETFDPEGMFTPGTNKIVIPAAYVGYWMVGAYGYFDGHATAGLERAMMLCTEEGGVDTVRVVTTYPQQAGAFPTHMNITTIIKGTPFGRSFKLHVLQRSGGNLTFRDYALWCYYLGGY